MKIERFLRRFAPAVILFNVAVALLWIPAFIYGLFSSSKPDKTLPTPEVQKPPELPPQPLPKPEPEPLPKPEVVLPVQVERKEEKVEREERKVKREEKPQAKVKQKEEKREERKEEKKTEVKVEEKPPKGPFGFACRGGDCYLFDVSTGRRYRKGETIDGWLIKDVDVHGATLVKNGKQVRVGIE